MFKGIVIVVVIVRVFVVPEILADRHTYSPVPDQKDRRFRSRFEIAQLIEDVVERQQLFLVGPDQLATINHGRHISKWFTNATVPVDVTHHDMQTRRCRSRCGNNLLQNLQVALNKFRVIQQVLAEITGDGQFREYNQIACLC